MTPRPLRHQPHLVRGQFHLVVSLQQVRRDMAAGDLEVVERERRVVDRAADHLVGAREIVLVVTIRTAESGDGGYCAARTRFRDPRKQRLAVTLASAARGALARPTAEVRLWHRCADERPTSVGTVLQSRADAYVRTAGSDRAMCYRGRPWRIARPGRR